MAMKKAMKAMKASLPRCVRDARADFGIAFSPMPRSWILAVPPGERSCDMRAILAWHNRRRLAMKKKAAATKAMKAMEKKAAAKKAAAMQAMQAMKAMKKKAAAMKAMKAMK